MGTPSEPSDATAGGQGPREDAGDEALTRFVERFASILQEAGFPRMPARVFAFVLADDAESYTAAELASGLQVSPAAISGAARYLVQAGLLGRERRPGSRSDHYRVYDDDVWSAILLQQIPILERHAAFLEESSKLLDQRRPGGRRIQETLEFYRFMRMNLPMLVSRWQEHRRRHGFDADTLTTR